MGTSTLTRDPETTTERPFVSIREAAELIGVDRRTLPRQIEAGRFPLEIVEGVFSRPVLRRADVLSLITGDTQSA